MPTASPIVNTIFVTKMLSGYARLINAQRPIVITIAIYPSKIGITEATKAPNTNSKTIKAIGIT